MTGSKILVSLRCQTNFILKPLLVWCRFNKIQVKYFPITQYRDYSEVSEGYMQEQILPAINEYQTTYAK
jgi:hypothetical protein